MLRTIASCEKAGRKNHAAAYERVAELLKRPSRKRPGVNLYKISMHAKDGETVVVPGKVLAVGTLGKKITLASFGTTGAAVGKVAKSGSKLISIQKLVEENPSGKGVKIIV